MTDPIRAALERLHHYAEMYPEDDTDSIIARARAALDEPEGEDRCHRPAPPAEREVMEVLADLRYSAHRYRDRGFFPDARRCTRAADLIERLASPLPGGEAKT